jgi:hypothetical protein
VTAQVHELLIVDGEETSMAFCPPLPDSHPRIYEPSPDEVIKDESDLTIGSTACWRGYMGTWEIRDGLFYLAGLCGRFQLREGEPILAEWFSGVIRVPKGEILQYVHMGYGSVFEQELHIKIENGVVVATRVIDNRGKKHDELEIAWKNLPGDENRFAGDDNL